MSVHVFGSFCKLVPRSYHGLKIPDCTVVLVTELTVILVELFGASMR